MLRQSYRVIASSLAKIASSKSKSKYISEKDWNKVTAASGITHTTNVSTTISSTGARKETNVITSIGRADINVTTVSSVGKQNYTSTDLNVRYKLKNDEEVLFIQSLNEMGAKTTPEQAIMVMQHISQSRMNFQYQVVLVGRR